LLKLYHFQLQYRPVKELLARRAGVTQQGWHKQEQAQAGVFYKSKKTCS
jgi:hypothetical protein